MKFGVPMVRAILAGFAALLLGSFDASAAGRESLGWGRLFNNDYLGDQHDRWRTGSYVVSKVIGYGWTGALPERAGEIIEFRFRSGTIAPEDIVTPAPGDRRYAGTLAFGVHTHFQRRSAEISLGGELVFTGPQTGIGELQTQMHKLFGAAVPGVLGTQIPNGVHPTARIEVGRTFRLSPTLSLRPFLEAQGGAETLLRMGGDVTFGHFGQRDLMMRDVVTGQRYRAGSGGDHTGFSAVLGADFAHVEHSVYLPAYDPVVMEDQRARVRAGVHWQGRKSSAFYGVTWLSEEFVGQRDSQLVGSLRINIRF